MSSRTVIRKSRRVVGGGGGLIDDGDIGETVSVSRNYQVYRGMSPTTSSRIENRTKELEEALEVERAAHLRTQKEFADFHFQFESLADKLEEAEKEISNQSELARKREQELLKAKKDAELLVVQYEASESSAKKRFLEQIADLTEQLERANKNKSKFEKDKQQLVIEIEGFATQIDAANKAKSYAESKLEAADDQIRRLKAQIDELTLQNQDLSQQRGKLAQENADLQRQLQDLDSSYGALSKAKNQLQQKLDETKSKLEEEIRIRVQFEGQFGGLGADLDNARSQLDEATERVSSLNVQLQKGQNDYQQLKNKYDKDVLIVTEELEESRRKLQARIADLEGQLDQAKNKINRLEKEKNKLNIDINELTIAFDDANAALADSGKRLKSAESLSNDLQKRVDELNIEVNNGAGDNKRLAAEVAQLKANLSDLQGKFDALQRENNKLTEAGRELESNNKDLARQLGELTTIRIELQNERDAIRNELNDALDAIRDLKDRLDAANSANNQLRLELENKLREKDEELENIRRLSQRTIDELRVTVVDLETKLKNESSRLKKKWEQERQELEIQIDVLNRSNAELAKGNKNLATKLKETEALLDGERRSLQESRDSVTVLERKLVSLEIELDDARALATAADKARKKAEGDLSESQSSLTEINVLVQNLTNDKRRYEADFTALQRDFDDALAARRGAEERAEKLAMELARVNDQLRQEQATVGSLESNRKQLEVQIRELNIHIEEIESSKDGRKSLASLQARVTELETELELERRRSRDAQADVKKLQRQLSDLRASAESDHQLVLEYTETINSLQIKIANLKRQLQDNEEILGITMGKYRKTQQLLEEAERRADKNLTSTQSSVVRHTTVNIGAGGAGGYGLSVGVGPAGIASRRRAMSVQRDVSRVISF